MASKPQEEPLSSQETTEPMEASSPSRDRVVISGMTGLYPNARHVKDLANILYNKINPVTSNESRWVFKHVEMTDYTGKIPDLNRFDAQFFKVHYYLGAHLDAMCRKILEQAYTAIYDAGLNPQQLNGKKVGVFIGASMSETEKISFYNTTVNTKTALTLLGCNKSMFANRISYWLNLKGPSIFLDQAGCSSTGALELAYQAIQRGDCESAIVGACSLCLHPQSLIHYGRLFKLSKDGKTKSFDQNANGSIKSEAINVLFLQKAKDALRIYAELVNVKSHFIPLKPDEMYPKNLICGQSTDIAMFLKQFYDESNVPPQAVEYVEGCGLAIPEADKAELEVYEKVFCGDRDSPLLVGSIISNIGNVEAASGISGITKILLGYHTGVLAGNLHCETPRLDVKSLREGNMVIVNDNVPLGHGYTAFNGYSGTGVNAHVILNGHYKPKDPTRYKSEIPHLVFVSGRQETAVDNIFTDLKSRPIDPEEIALLNNAHGSKISGHLGRGFIILDTDKENKTVSLHEKVTYLDYVKRPIWFVYSGMGSQYNGMGIGLMSIPVFAAAIEKCQRVLKPKGIDIIHIITSPDKTIFNNILNSFVGIAAIQIGLTDILRELGIVPDKIIGHSLGELGCAYADNCFTAEEMILSAYSRGLISLQTPFIRGSMAAVGLGYQQIISMCPPEIEVACHNSSDTCTISGPDKIMQEFVASLLDKHIFAKEVPCSNIAYHSRYIANAGPGLLRHLSEIIKTPKVRSERWVSTSIPMNKWDQPSAKYSSAEYHTNNLLNTVLFEETSKLIPPNAIVVEIAPHGLLQSILKRSLPKSCTNIPLTRRGRHDSAIFFLEAIGNFYIHGLHPKIQSLYPKIEFPVSTGTPMLSHLVEWVHSEKWRVPLYLSPNNPIASATVNNISIHDEEHAYLQGHVIGGKILYPFSATLVAVWDTLAMSLGVPKRRLPVQFHDVILHVQPIMHDRRHLRLNVAIHRNFGRFEVMDDLDSRVASGFINCVSELLHDVNETESLNINSKEIYNHFLSRGYAYKDCFQSIHNTNLSLTEARIRWSGNWVTFIDGLFQLNNLRHSHNTHCHVNFIGKLSINPHKQDEFDDTHMTAVVMEPQNLTKCGGVLMEKVTFNDMPMPSQNSLKLKALKFVPHFSSDQFDFKTILQVYLQIVAENVDIRPISILGIYNNENTLSKFNEIKRILRDEREVTTAFTWLKRGSIVNEQKNIFSDAKIVLICNLATDDYMCKFLHEVVVQNTFIINIRDSVNNLSNVSRPSALYQVLCDHSVQSSEAIELSRWRAINKTAFTSVISVNSPSDLPLTFHEINSLLPHQKLLITTTYPAVPGLKNLLNQFKNKSGCNINLIMNDNDVQGYDGDALVSTDLAVKVIENDVLGGEYYVPLRNICNVKGKLTLQGTRLREIESLKWVQALPQQNHGISVKVHYAGLNDLDVKKLTGLVPCDSKCTGYGMDFSGISESGTRVMGLVNCGAASTHIQAVPDLLWPVPSYWSLEDAATVPFAYCLAYYCLSIKYQLQPGMRVLVHGGAGALGQAIISLALANHCDVFATVGNIHKKQFLLKMYPALKAKNIDSSRDSTFCNLVLNATSGEGVDIVISTLKGELKTVSFKCVAHMGVMIDVTQIPWREHFNYGMYSMTKSRSYITVDFFSIFNEKGNTMKKLQHLVSDGIAKGWVRPLSRVVYTPGKASRAFRLLASRNQRGRVLLHLQQAYISSIRAQSRLQCSPEKNHVIISDHKNFGLQMADMLIQRGVRNIFLYLPVSQEDFKLKMKQWQRQGVEVRCGSTEKFTNTGDYSYRNILPENIEGIYIFITNHKSLVEINSIVETIDAATRKMDPDLKYFVVINTINSVGEEICLSRNEAQIAATMLRLPELKEFSDNDNNRVLILEAVDIIERAITAEESVLSAYTVSTQATSLLHQIAAVAGVKISQDNEGTLLDLGMDREKANIVTEYLHSSYNVYFTAEAIQALTVERIKFIEETLTKTSFENHKGLDTLFTYVDADEIVATTEMIYMPTLTSSATEPGIEFDVSSPYLCIVPGVEGHYGRFRPMCKRLKLPALVLQPDLGRPYETIPEMAHRYAEILSQTASPKKHFYLLGYESGVFVVLEMAAILEEKGFTTLVFCIGTPEGLNSELKEHLKGLDTEKAMQDAILRHMFIKMTNSAINELELALERVSTWQEKLDITVNTLLGRVSHSAQYARELIVAAHGRIISLLRYEFKIQLLRSQLIVLQPTPSTTITDLHRISQHPVVCHKLQAPLSQALEDLRCAAIVNAHLDADILKEFENKNLCKSYSLGIDAALTWSCE